MASTNSNDETDILVDTSPHEALEIRKMMQCCWFSRPNNIKLFEPAKIQMVRNPKLQSQFESRILELQQKQPAADVEIQAGFLVEQNLPRIKAMTKNGLQTADKGYSKMGYSYEGVYLCRYANICLEEAMNRLPPNCSVIRMIVCKFVHGRITKAIPRSAQHSEFIHPTLGFDCHQPLLPPSDQDTNISDIFDKTQVYLYEHDMYKQPQNFPRHVLPVAVVHFTEDGQYTPSMDTQVDVPLAAAVVPDNVSVVTETEVLAALATSHLPGSDAELSWKPAHVHILHNTALIANYAGKKQELSNFPNADTEDSWGFAIFDAAHCVLLGHNGLTAYDDSYSAMGFGSMGVYLSRHVDVVVRSHLFKRLANKQNVMYVLVCKMMLGRVTKAIPRDPGAFSFIKPTANFDCHESLFAVTENDTLQQQYDRSMVYLYELDAAGRPFHRPRQVLPVAVVCYTQDGQKVPGCSKLPSLAEAEAEIAASPILDAASMGRVGGGSAVLGGGDAAPRG